MEKCIGKTASTGLDCRDGIPESVVVEVKGFAMNMVPCPLLIGTHLVVTEELDFQQLMEDLKKQGMQFTPTVECYALVVQYGEQQKKFDTVADFRKALGFSE